MTGKLKAYAVHDGDEQTVVVFAKHGATARRLGAREMDLDFSEVESCRRSPGFDEYAPGPVPFSAKFDSGWWTECAGCGRRISQDECDEETDEPIKFNLIEVGERVYCTPSCCDASRAEHTATKLAEQLVIANLTEDMLRSLPGAMPCGRPHVYIARGRAEAALVGFTFPGERYGCGHFGWRKLGEKPSTSVCNGDLAAFDAWKAAGYPPHMMDAPV